MTRLACFLFLVLGLSGCDAFTAAVTSRTDKVNQAFPLSEDLSTAPGMLLKALKGDGREKIIRVQYEQLVDARAIKCSGATLIDRLDTPDEVRRKIGDASCFREFDATLSEWIGLNRAAIELAKPPLVALSALPPRFMLASSPVDSHTPLTIARSANIAAFRSTEKGYTVVELPSGRIINSFPLGSNVGAGVTLSPNGRVVALPLSPTGVKMLDVLTGNTLWSSPNHNDVLAWLPDVGAALLTRSRANTVALMDFQGVKLSPYPLQIPLPTWSAQSPDPSGPLVIGNFSHVAVVNHARRVDGSIEALPVQQIRLPSDSTIGRDQYYASGTPFLMSKSKKLVYMSRKEWNWLDLESGKVDKWNSSSLNTLMVAQMTDSVLLLLTGTSRIPRPAQLFDVEQGTIANAKGPALDSGILYSATPRLGYVFHSNGTVALGHDLVAEGEARPIDQVAGEIELAEQLAKLQNPGPEEQVNKTPFPGGQTAIASGPRMSGVPANAEVSVIGVYRPMRGRGREFGPIDVTVAPSKKPLVLVLSSYESVQWNIASNGRPIAAILLSSNTGSRVRGFEGNVVSIGQEFAYKIGTEDFTRLKASVARYVPMPIRLFQGAYSGAEFSVPAD